MPLSTGQIVNGKYRVIRLLGDGGMGSVYEAHHEVLGTRVALKLLHPELSRTGIAKRFLQEARASARIQSPHVVRVADADQTADGLAFIVLEYLEGRTLGGLYEELDRDHQKLPFNDALEYAMQMFEGVEAAHAAGIVHRDLKPDNVMITVDPRGAPLLKLLDFGIAKVDEPPESTGSERAQGPRAPGPALTRPGALLGTPEYMAPEQVYSAGSADARSDIFSLGVILFEMLSGRRPVLSEDPQQIAVSYLTGAFTRLEEACPGVPPDLALAVHRALAAQPRDRFASVAELRAAVEPFAPPRPLPQGRLSMVGSMLPAPSSLPRPPQDGGRAPIPPASAPARSSLGTAPMMMASAPTPTSSAHQSPARGASMSDPPRPRVIPETNSYPQGPQQGGTVAISSFDASLPPTPPATAFVQNPPAPQPGAGFTPEYPGAAPFSTAVGAPSAVAGGPSPGFVPEYPPPAFGPVSASRPSLPGMPGWQPPPSTSSALAPRPGASKKVWILAALAALLVVTGITLGALYALGWLDADPPAKPHKTTPKPKAPAPHPGGALR